MCLTSVGYGEDILMQPGQIHHTDSYFIALSELSMSIIRRQMDGNYIIRRRLFCVLNYV